MTIATNSLITAEDILGLAVASGTVTNGSLVLTLANGSTVTVQGSLGTPSLGIAGATGNGSSVTLPAGAVITQILFTETAGHAATVTLGTTPGAADVMAATAVPAGGIVPATALSLLAQAFAASQAIYLSSAGWGGARISLKVWYVQ